MNEKEKVDVVNVISWMVYVCHCCSEAKMSKDEVGYYSPLNVEDVGPDLTRFHYFNNCSSCIEKYTVEEREDRCSKHWHYLHDRLEYFDVDKNGKIVEEG
mgnify:CR=1 FL=1